MFEFIKKMFIVSLTNVVNASNHTKCVSLSNQKCEIQPTFTNLHPDEGSQELHYVYIYVFNMITEINESKIFRKHISCKC